MGPARGGVVGLAALQRAAFDDGLSRPDGSVAVDLSSAAA